MPLNKWLLVFLASSILFAGIFAGFNALVDPFGVFGDKLVEWWAYDMTQNPRTAKIGYLDRYHDNYDSYIIGCSKTSSYPTELLNRYFGGASFYNLTMYGGDLYDACMTARYVLSRYKADHIVLNMGLEELARFGYVDDPVKGNLHAKVDGSNLVRFYTRYLLSNPSYSVEKLRGLLSRSYLVDANRVFQPETGVYDKSLRDTEPVGSLEEYMAKYPEFGRGFGPYESLPHIDDCLEAIAVIKQCSEAAGATFTLIISPMSAQELDLFPKGELMAFFRRLAAVTDFWDFTGYHSVAYEPRYFYDMYHHRNAVGAMALARMFGDEGVYVPGDFGVKVTADNVEARLKGYLSAPPEDLGHDRQVPILLYHHISDQPGESTVTEQTFRAQIKALSEAGFKTVPLSALVDFVERGTPLLTKPLVITFDDGYRSNLEVAAPILAEYGMCATVSVIGVSIGKDTYKDKDEEIIPHFSLEEARPWIEAGVLDIQSHSYDMHHSPRLDADHFRRGVLRMQDESEADYVAAFRSDFGASREEIEGTLGTTVTAYAYPFGIHTELAEVLLWEMGIKISLTVEEGVNTVVKGLPQSLLCLRRNTVGNDLTPEQLVAYVEGLR